MPRQRLLRLTEPTGVVRAVDSTRFRVRVTTRQWRESIGSGNSFRTNQEGRLHHALSQSIVKDTDRTPLGFPQTPLTLREEKVERKREGQILQRQTRARALGRKVAAVQKLLQVAVQMTAQFIRSLRNGILSEMRWLNALELLRASTKAYL